MEPFILLALYTVILNIFIAFVYYKLTDMNELRRLKAEAKEMNKKVAEARKSGNLELANKLNAEYVKASFGQTQKTMKPMMVSLIVFMVALWYFGTVFATGINMKLPFTLPLFGPDITWVGWYVLVTMASSYTFRKLFGTM